MLASARTARRQPTQRLRRGRSASSPSLFGGRKSSPFAVDESNVSDIVDNNNAVEQKEQQLQRQRSARRHSIHRGAATPVRRRDSRSSTPATAAAATTTTTTTSTCSRQELWRWRSSSNFIRNGSALPADILMMTDSDWQLLQEQYMQQYNNTTTTTTITSTSAASGSANTSLTNDSEVTVSVAPTSRRRNSLPRSERLNILTSRQRDTTTTTTTTTTTGATHRRRPSRQVGRPSSRTLAQLHKTMDDEQQRSWTEAPELKRAERYLQTKQLTTNKSTDKLMDESTAGLPRNLVRKPYLDDKDKGQAAMRRKLVESAHSDNLHGSAPKLRSDGPLDVDERDAIRLKYHDGTTQHASIVSSEAPDMFKQGLRHYDATKSALHHNDNDNDDDNNNNNISGNDGDKLHPSMVSVDSPDDFQRRAVAPRQRRHDRNFYQKQPQFDEQQSQHPSIVSAEAPAFVKMPIDKHFSDRNTSNNSNASTDEEQEPLQFNLLEMEHTAAAATTDTHTETSNATATEAAKQRPDGVTVEGDWYTKDEQQQQQQQQDTEGVRHWRPVQEIRDDTQETASLPPVPISVVPPPQLHT